MRTYRRLNDPTRYYGLSWRGWLGVAIGAALLYAIVRLSPLAIKPTITLTVFVLGGGGTVLWALSGQALGIGRYLAAILTWRFGAKQLTAPEQPVAVGGVRVDRVPEQLLAQTLAEADWLEESMNGEEL
jgi:hypothetical protein